MPRYSSTRNQMVRGDDVTLLASAARTAGATGSSVPCDEYTEAILTLAVTAVTGTNPTLDVNVETSYDGTNWVTAAAFTQATIVGTETKAFSGLGRLVRAKAPNAPGGTGTPTFTYSVSGYLK